MDRRTVAVLALASALTGCGGSDDQPPLPTPAYDAMLAADDDYDQTTKTLARAQEQCGTEGNSPQCGDYLFGAMRSDSAALKRWTAAYTATRPSARGACLEALGGLSMAVAAHSQAFTDYMLAVSDRKPAAAAAGELTEWRDRRLPDARQAFVDACARPR